MKGSNILLSRSLEMKKGFLEDALLQLRPEADRGKREGRVCRERERLVRSPFGGRERPVHLVSAVAV